VNDSLPITAIALLPLMGMVAYVGVQHLWLWRGHRDEPLHLWAVGWCANTLLLLVSHYVQVATRSPDRAAAWARIAWMSALLLIPLVIGLVRALVGVPSTPASRLLVGIATAGLLAASACPVSC